MLEIQQVSKITSEVVQEALKSSYIKHIVLDRRLQGLSLDEFVDCVDVRYSDGARYYHGVKEIMWLCYDWSEYMRARSRYRDYAAGALIIFQDEYTLVQDQRFMAASIYDNGSMERLRADIAMFKPDYIIGDYGLVSELRMGVRNAKDYVWLPYDYGEMVLSSRELSVQRHVRSLIARGMRVYALCKESADARIIMTECIETPAYGSCLLLTENPEESQEVIEYVRDWGYWSREFRQRGR